MSKGYLFYDTETSGLSKCFDQVFQFAAIKTDLALNEISRHEIIIKKNPDCVPAPEALITHRINAALLESGVPEVEGLRQIHALLNAPNTISLGYNTLGFDDEFLRFSFYRNLLPPYTHQYANGCYRADLYPVTALYHNFSEDSLAWPTVDGKESLKLDALSQLNQLAVGQAHNAMVDVEATVALAKKLKANASLWDYVMGYFHKATDVSRMQNIEGDALALTGRFGFSRSFLAPVVHLGQHRHYKNQSIWLRLDHSELSSATLDNLDEKSGVVRKRAGEDPFILPPKARYCEKLSEACVAQVEKNKAWLLAHPAIAAGIKEYHLDYTYPDVSGVDADAQLYMAGFPSRDEEGLMREFHLAKPADKLCVADRFRDDTRRELALRVVGRAYPDVLNADQATAFKRYLDVLDHEKSAPIDYRGNMHLTRDVATQREKTAREASLDDEQLTVLNSYHGEKINVEIN